MLNFCITLFFGSKSLVSKMKHGFVTFNGYLKNQFRICPFRLIFFNPIKLTLCHKPYNFLVGNKLDYSLLRIMRTWMNNGKFIIKFGGVTFKIFAAPPF